MGAQVADGAHLEGATITLMSAFGLGEFVVWLLLVTVTVAFVVAVIRIGFRRTPRS